MNSLIIKDITEIGVLIVMAGIFLKQQQKMFDKLMLQQDNIAVTMSKLEENLNNDNLKGKSLEMMLNLKVQGLRWSLQKRIINYILRNNIRKNWDLITREIQVIIEEKKHEFFMSLKDITETTILKVEMLTLNEELEVTKDLIFQILEGLKEHGEEDEALYEVAQRSTEMHFEHFETRMVKRHSELLN